MELAALGADGVNLPEVRANLIIYTLNTEFSHTPGSQSLQYPECGTSLCPDKLRVTSRYRGVMTDI